MSVPQAVIDEILARVDIVDVIRPRVPLKKAGREWHACCPFHNEKTPSFTVSPKKQFYYCFGCHASGNALKFLMDFERLEFRPALESLANIAGVDIPDDRPADNQSLQLRREERDALEQAQVWFRDQFPRSPAADYMERRGVNAAMLERYGVGYAPERPQLQQKLSAVAAERAGLLLSRDDGSHFDRFRNRVMFPIRDNRGRIVGFGGRTLGDDKAKYLNSPETPLFHKGRLLYGLYEVRQHCRNLPGFVVVEGYMDVISLAQHGIDYAVATLGTAATADHVEQLLRIHPRLNFCFDGDKAGRRAAAHALEVALPLVRDGHDLRFLFLPDGHDPDTLVREQGQAGFEALLDSAEPLSRYFLRSLEADLNIATAEGRAALAQRASEKLKSVRAPAYKLALEQLVRERTRIDMPSVAPQEQASRHDDYGPPPPRARTQRRWQDLSPRNDVEHAFVLLLNWPEMAQQINDIEALAELSTPGAELLSRVLDTLHEEPELNCGALLQRFAHEPEAGRLHELAQWDREIGAEPARNELQAIVSRLLDRERDGASRVARISELAAKPFAELTADERRELQELTLAKANQN